MAKVEPAQGRPGRSSSQARSLKSAPGRIVQFIRNYWILATIPGVILGVVISVNRVRDYYEIRSQVAYHIEVGIGLLDRGHHQEAKRSFANALDLVRSTRLAAQAVQLCDLFMDAATPTWVPSRGWVGISRLQESGLVGDLTHVYCKYVADLYRSMDLTDSAAHYYRAALEHKPEYLSALLDFGWFWHDDNETLEPDSMVACFRKAIAAEPLDYRAAHGLGWTQYLRSLREKDYTTKQVLLDSALMQCRKAADLHPSALEVVIDLGEVARPLDPELALRYHRALADRILADSVLLALPENRREFVFADRPDKADAPRTRLRTLDRKKKWLEFQRSLDYTAQYWCERDSEAGRVLSHLADSCWRLASDMPGAWLDRQHRTRLEAMKDLFPVHRWGNYRIGLTTYGEQMRRGGDPAQSFCFRGILSDRQRKTQDAIVYYENALSRDPSHTLANFRCGAARLKVGDLDLAVQHLQKAIELERTLAPAYWLMAHARYRQREHGKAADHLRTVAGLTNGEPPYRPAVELCEGFERYCAGDYEGAVRQCAKALVDAQREWYALGDCEDRMIGEPVFYIPPLRMHSMRSLAQALMGDAWDALGQPDSAARFWRLSRIPLTPSRSGNIVGSSP